MEIGDPLPSFKLINVDGKEYGESSFKKKMLLVIFSCNHCPYVQAYEERIKRIQEEFKDELDVVCINSNDDKQHPEDGFEEMVCKAEEKDFNFYYLRDETQKAAQAFGGLVTPECFLFDEDRLLRYRGRIDDSWKISKDVSKEELKDALKALFTGQEVPEEETEAIGCSIKWKN